MKKLQCSEDYTLEPIPGLFRVCPENECKEWIKEGLRAIAELRTQTCVLIEEVCTNHLPE